MRIGIIGPSDSGKKVASVMEKYFPELIPQIYQVSKTEEAYREIDKYEKECQGLIFTGMGVYYKTIEKTDISLPYVYIPVLSSSIMKAMWELKDRFPNCKGISIDAVDRTEVDETIEELNLSGIGLEIMEYNHLIPEQRYVDFHIDVHRRNKEYVSIIALGWVFEQVKSQGYPAIRLYSTKGTIRNTISDLIYMINEVKVKYSNLAVQVLYTKAQEDISQYRQLEISSLIQSNLIGYLKEIQGSVFRVSWNEYIIFSTRGAVENRQNLVILKNILDFMKKEGIKIFVGTGLGITSHESEINANKALKAAINQGYSCIFKVEDSRIEGPLLDEGEFSYNFMMDHEKINKMAEMIDLSPLYIQKINSIKENFAKDTFTSDELAKYLGVSNRTATRIFKKILDSNCGEEVGFELNKSVGRPKKMIKINFN